MGVFLTTEASTDDKLIFLAGVKHTAMLFQEIVASHPASKDLRDEVMGAWMALGNLFNKAADLHHRALIDAPGNPPGFIPRKTNYWLEAQAPGVGGVQEYVESVINVGHYHELMDRCHCIEEMFDLTVENHIVAQLLTNEVSAAGIALGDMFQAAATLHHDKATAAEQKG